MRSRATSHAADLSPASGSAYLESRTRSLSSVLEGEASPASSAGGGLPGSPLMEEVDVEQMRMYGQTDHILGLLATNHVAVNWRRGKFVQAELPQLSSAAVRVMAHEEALLAVGTDKGHVIVRSLAVGGQAQGLAPPAVLDAHARKPVTALAVGGGHIVSGGADCKAFVWPLAAVLASCDSGGDVPAPIELAGHRSVVTCVLVLPNGRLCTGCNDGGVRVYSATDGSCERTIASLPDDGVSCMTLGEDDVGKPMLFVGGGRTVIALAIEEDFTVAARVDKAHASPIFSLAASGARIVTGAVEEVKMWERVRGNQLACAGTLRPAAGARRLLRAPVKITGVQIVPAPTACIIVGCDRHLVAFDSQTGEKLWARDLRNGKIVSVVHDGGDKISVAAGKNVSMLDFGVALPLSPSRAHAADGGAVSPTSANMAVLSLEEATTPRASTADVEDVPAADRRADDGGPSLSDDDQASTKEETEAASMAAESGDGVESDGEDIAL